MASDSTTIRLLADITGFTSGMDKAVGATQRSMAQIESAANTAGANMRHTLRAAVAGFGVVEFGRFIKSSIDAADAMNDMSQRTGVAIKDLASYKLAAEQSGTSLESIAKGIKGMGAAMLENGSALRSAGISAKDANGSLRQTADLFAAMPDGIEKTQLAVKLFGKAGMDLIPMLNLGSKGLDDAANASARYAAVMVAIAPDADKFNDQVKELSIYTELSGMSIAQHFLPGLIGMSQWLVDVASGGAKAQAALQFLAESDSPLVRGVAKLSQFFNKPKTDGWAMAGMDKTTGRTKPDKIEPPAVNAAAFDAKEKEIRARVKKLLEALGIGDKDAKKAADDFAAVMNKIYAKDSGLDASYWKDLDTLNAGMRAGKISADEYADAVGKLTSQQKFHTDEIALSVAAQKEWVDWTNKNEKALTNSTEALRDEVTKLREHNEEIGLSAAQMEALALARIDATLAAKEHALAILEETNQCTAESEALRDQIALLREKRSLTIDGAAREVAKKAAEESARAWEKFADDIERALTDALWQGFENGKGFGRNFIDSLKNMLKTSALKIVVQAVVDPITGSIKSAMGIGGAASSGGNLLTAANNIYSAGKNAYQMYNAVTGLGGQIFNDLAASSLGVKAGLSTANTFSAPVYEGSVRYLANAESGAVGYVKAGEAVSEASGSAANLTKLGETVKSAMTTALAAWAGSAIGNSIAGEYRIAKFSASDMGAVLGSFLGPIGGFFGGVIGGVLDRAFGMGKVETTGTGVQGTFSGSSFAGNSYQDWHQNGGWFRSDKSGTNTFNLPPDTTRALSLAFGGIKAQVTSLAESLNAPTSAIAGYSRTIRQSLDAGSSATLFESMANDMAALALAGTNYANSGDAALATLTRLSSSLQTVNSWLTRYNARLLQTSLASGNAASKLIDLMGGIEKFAAAEEAYYTAYFDQSKRATEAQKQLTDAMTAFGLTAPTTKAEFVKLVDSLDLTTEGGRAAHAALIALAPAFADTVAAIEQVAREAAANLIKTFTADGRLPIVLASVTSITEDYTAALADADSSLVAVTGAISTLFLDVSSGLITFTDATVNTGDSLTAAQMAAGALTDGIDALASAAQSGIIDFSGLSAALANVDTATFVATVTGVFEVLRDRLKNVLSSISDARVAVREDALKIINPGAMTKAAIERGIAGVQTSLPSIAGLTNANRAVTSIDTRVADSEARLAGFRSAQGQLIDKVNVGISNIWSLASKWGVGLEDGSGGQARFDVNSAGQFEAVYNAIRYTTGQDYRPIGFRNDFYASGGAYDQTYGQAGALQTAAGNVSAESASLAALKAEQTAAAAAAKQAALDYAKSLQDFALNADLSVKKLNRLRTETMKFYDEQARLANAMQSGAASLRATVEEYRFGQLSDAGKFDALQTKFSTAYAMGLSTTGDTLVDYGNRLNSLLAPMLEAARAVLDGGAYDTFAANAIARAETIAGRLDSLAPSNYENDSLDLLGQIDTALGALDESTLSANAALISAIDAGKELTASGLRAVVAAIAGDPIPAFATGGYHSGGLRLVGENGPELEVTGPSRIYTASQTAAMLSGGGDMTAVCAELQALRDELADLRVETRATAINTGKTARLHDRWETDGLTVRTDASEPLATVAA